MWSTICNLMVLTLRQENGDDEHLICVS